MQSQSPIQKVFSLTSYLTYVGLPDFKPTPSLETLEKLIHHHLETFYYQNSALVKAGMMLGASRTPHIPSLKIDELYPLMAEQHSGYCMQHLELFYAVLTAAGFKVDRHLAKMVLTTDLSSEGRAQSKTHELLIVHVNDEKYVVDVGLGNLCMRKPIKLVAGIHEFDNEQYRLTQTDQKWSLDVKKAKDTDKWFCIYRFFSTPASELEVDRAHTNLYLTKEPLTIRDELFYVAKTSNKGRQAVSWSFQTGSGSFWSLKKETGKEKNVEITSYDDAVACAKKKFGYS